MAYINQVKVGTTTYDVMGLSLGKNDESLYSVGSATNPVYFSNGIPVATNLDIRILSSLPSSPEVGVLYVVPAQENSASQPYILSSSAPSDTSKIWIDTANSNIAKVWTGSTWSTLGAVWS